MCSGDVFEHGKLEMLPPWSPSQRFPIRGQGTKDKEMHRQMIRAMVCILLGIQDSYGKVLH